MNKIISLLLCCYAFCACSTVKDYSLEKSIWYNSTIPVYNNAKDVMVTSMHFVSNNEVNIFTSVLNENGYEVTPFLYATGNWDVTGNPKKEANISIFAKTIEGKKLTYKGKFYKEEGMLLSTEDAQTTPFIKIKGTKLP